MVQPQLCLWYDVAGIWISAYSLKIFVVWIWLINSLAPGSFVQNFRLVIFKLILMTGGWGNSCKIALRWMPLDLTFDKSTLLQVMAWCRQTTSHYLSQSWSRSLVPLGRNELKSLGPSDAIWWHTFGSKSAQVNAFWLMAPSHYLNQCWLNFNEDLWNSPESNFTVSHHSVKKSYLQNHCLISQGLLLQLLLLLNQI